MLRSLLFRLAAAVLLLFAFSPAQVHAQCTIDYTQTAPGLYPDTLPPGLVGSLYSEDVTFVMPLDTQGFAFTNFEIVSITGLPFGLSWVCNNQANGCNYDPAQSQYGCINVNGTPILPGTYQLEVLVIASLGVLGDYPTQYFTPITILPDTTSNNGFSMANAFGCAPITVEFNNNNPGLLAYNWDFGNGNSSTAENPTPQIYNTPGTYQVTYEGYSDTTPDYYLTEVQVLGVPNSWGWPTDLDPDIYIQVIDSSGAVVHTSGTVQNQDPPVTFAIPNLPLGAMNYTVHVWDEDGGVFGADDDLGSTTFWGQGPSGSSTSGSTSISFAITELGPFPSVTSSDSVQVFGYPNTPNIDSSGLLLWTDSTTLTLQWYQDGNPITGADSATYPATESGNYWVISTSPAGCFASSDTIEIVVCDPSFSPSITESGHILFTDSTGNQIQWYHDGAALTGETSQLIVTNDNGDYWVTVTTIDGCVYTSDTINLDFTGVHEFGLTDQQWNLWPNPGQNEFFYSLQLDQSREVLLEVLDVSGRAIHTERVLASRNFQGNFNLSGQAPGLYLVRLSVNGQSVTKRLVKR